MRPANRKSPLQTSPDEAILRLARVLARLAAREDHEREQANRTKKRAATYARFSTDLQNERSIEDQLSLCQSYADREGLSIVRTYDDRARSGGSLMGRHGLLTLLDDAREKSFDIVIVEALDRLSRDMEDLAGIHKRLSFLGIEIRAVHEGVVNTVLVGLRGLVGQLYREDNAHKVRRGLAGRINQGLAAGGLTYGYAAISGRSGERVIVEGEAEAIRRIFQEYVEGRTPREIAHDLNRDGVSPPRGRAWNASTINGNLERGAGILQNELYVGRLVWNKVRMVKDPDTGKRLSRPNPRSEWQVAECRILRLSNPSCSPPLRSAKKSAITPIPVINVGRAGCCLVCSVAVRAAPACRPMAKTNRGAFVFDAQLRRRAARALTQRRSI